MGETLSAKICVICGLWNSACGIKGVSAFFVICILGYCRHHPIVIVIKGTFYLGKPLLYNKSLLFYLDTPLLFNKSFPFCLGTPLLYNKSFPFHLDKSLLYNKSFPFYLDKPLLYNESFPFYLGTPLLYNKKLPSNKRASDISIIA